MRSIEDFNAIPSLRFRTVFWIVTTIWNRGDITQYINRCISNVYEADIIWLEIKMHVTEIVESIEVIYWTHYGTVDTKRHEELLVQDERNDIELRYSMACHDCFEDILQKLYDLLSDRQRERFLELNRNRELVQENSVESKQRSGRSRIFNECEERWIVRDVHINPRSSALKMTSQRKSRFRKSVNPETVRNVLRKHKYHGRVPQRKLYICKENRQARLAFAKMYWIFFDVRVWLRATVVALTGESEANSQVYVETPLHPEKLTVWCALWAGGILLQKR
ncbi:transposable element Tc1 transposase [Trichonephila clavipes]|uniref:Transposable element Tc1 transposase n=1 Tax=Trichonephila clavipes TaxID=2585209 RepID=A0A8X6SG87_TRICX|nr:transposable element Tc1 transposase [Trichonephila clavipes]